MGQREEFEFKAAQAGVPDHTIPGIARYVFDGCPPGDFLTAVFCNDLKESFGRADEENSYCLVKIVGFLYNHAPAACWGSEEKMNAWIKARQAEREGGK